MPGVSEMARLEQEAAEAPLFGIGHNRPPEPINHAAEASRQWGIMADGHNGHMIAKPAPRYINLDTMPGGKDHRETLPVVNPKELAGAKKPATWSVMPRWIILLVGRVMSVGAAKYGAFNYRDSAISASVYQDALERHLGLWFDGEDDDAETGVSHLASAIASCCLLLDAQATGKLNDDRQKTGLTRKHLDALEGLLVSLPLPSPKG